LNSKADENIVIMIVGNKVDLADNREVKTTTG
jgi:GTPase SAR1 family protein